MSDEIWRALSKASFAVISHVTPAGEPRSSGVLYIAEAGRLFVVVAADSWKARHIHTDRPVAVTVPVRRGGLLSLLMPIPPATISFAGVATSHPGEMLERLPRLAKLIPPERRAGCVVLEIRPRGHYVTYGIGVPLAQMRDPARSRARIPVQVS